MLPSITVPGRLDRDDISVLSVDDSVRKRSKSKPGPALKGIKKSSSGSLPSINSARSVNNVDAVSTNSTAFSLDIEGLESSMASVATTTKTHESDTASLQARKADEQRKINLSIEEEYKLLLKEKKKKAEEDAKAKKIADLPKKKFAPYMETLKHKEIKKAKEKQKKASENAILSMMNAEELNNLFILEAKENTAATLIQRRYRKSRVLNPWRAAVARVKGIVSIQKIIRGFVTRKWVAGWIYRKVMYVIKWQGFLRKHLSNKHIRPIHAWEKDCCTLIQKTIRGKLGRIRFREHLFHLCSTRIQAMWRGIVDRNRVDRMWLNKTVIPIQRVVRSMISRKKCRSVREELDSACLIIQRRYRIWTSVNRIGLTLFEREMSNRMDVIEKLRKEEEWCSELLVKLGHRLQKIDLKGKVQFAADEFNDALAEIYRLEKDTQEMKRQREILSPRAVQQGWGRDLEVNAHRMKGELAKKKLECIFTNNVNLQGLEFLMEHKVLEIEDIANNRDQIGHWRDQEYNERRERTYWRGVVARRKAKRQAVADEKRRWTVVWTTKNGKPDKRRRPGKPWDPSIFAGPDKQTPCIGGNIDLFANNPNPDGGTLKAGSKESVDKTLDKYALQNYLDQVNQYDKMVQPLSNILTDHITGGTEVHTEAAPDDQFKRQGGGRSRRRAPVAPPIVSNVYANSKPETKGAFGMGDVGLEVIPAMVNIGAISEPAPYVEYIPVEHRGPSKLIQQSQNVKRWGNVGGYGKMSKDGKMDMGEVPVVFSYSAAGGKVLTAKEVAAEEERKEREKLLKLLDAEEAERLEEERLLREEQEEARRRHYEEMAAERAEHRERRKERRREKREAMEREAEEARQALLEKAGGRGARSRSSNRDSSKSKSGHKNGVIPWALLDELEAEKYKLFNEKQFVEFNTTVRNDDVSV